MARRLSIRNEAHQNELGYNKTGIQAEFGAKNLIVINDDLWASISLEKPSEHIINNHFFEENIINGRFVVNSIGATAAATDIFFLKMPAEVLKIQNWNLVILIMNSLLIAILWAALI